MKTVNSITANETGFAVGAPLTVAPSVPSHKDATIEALRVMSEMVPVTHHQRKAMDAIIMFLESPQDQ